jgi:hypothetical protein
VYGTSIARVRGKSSSHIPSQDATVWLLPVRQGSQQLILTFRASCVSSHTEAVLVGRAIPLMSDGWGGYTSFKQGCHVPWSLAGSPGRPSAMLLPAREGTRSARYDKEKPTLRRVGSSTLGRITVVPYGMYL